MPIHVGTSGYAYAHWREIFYPRGLPVARWLGFYAAEFSTVEMNTTFYRLPPEGAAARWREATPKGFEFACKGSRFLTHMKRLTDVEQGPARFFDRVSGLGRKLRVVLWQLPPQMTRPDPARLDRFLAALPRRVRHAVEFRSANWYVDEVLAVLDARGAALCEHDLVEPPAPRATGGFRYVRFHGTRAHAGRYGRAALRPWARDLASWSASTGGDAWVYFNNDVGGHAITDARELRSLLG